MVHDVKSPEPEERPPLHYAVPSPANVHQVAGRWFIVLAVAIAVGVFASQIPGFWRRAQLLYWQHQCMSYVFSPAQPVLDVLQPTRFGFGATGKIAQPWETLYNLMSRPGMRSIATVFLHERVSPAGHHRLVAIGLHFDGHSLECGTRIIIPGDLVSGPKEILSAGKVVPFVAIQPEKVFGGVVDPADPSHFTFAIDGPDPGEMNGWLMDDDTIRLEFHQNPSTQPVPASPASSR
jgi:hypothetical protein